MTERMRRELQRPLGHGASTSSNGYHSRDDDDDDGDEGWRGSKAAARRGDEGRVDAATQTEGSHDDDDEEAPMILGIDRTQTEQLKRNAQSFLKMAAQAGAPLDAHRGAFDLFGPEDEEGEEEEAQGDEEEEDEEEEEEAGDAVHDRIASMLAAPADEKPAPAAAKMLIQVRSI